MTAEPLRDESSQLVVLLHGLGSGRLDMYRLSLFLKAAGYQTLNWGYKSLLKSIDWHASNLHQLLHKVADDDDINRLHVVGHSMGSIVARAALVKAVPQKLQRVVMLAPPNGGSHVARWLTPTIGRLVRPLREMSDHPESYVNALSEPTDCEIGVVAAQKDRVIRLANTHLNCQRDHIVLPGHHAILCWRKFAADQTIAFLRNGRFDVHEISASHSPEPVEK